MYKLFVAANDEMQYSAHVTHFLLERLLEKGETNTHAHTHGATIGQAQWNNLETISKAILIINFLCIKATVDSK